MGSRGGGDEEEESMVLAGGPPEVSLPALPLRLDTP